MHEFSIIESLISTAVGECRRRGFSKVEKIKILIGKASGVMPEALFFGFDVLKRDTIAGEASLVIEEVPVTGYCSNCSSSLITNEAFIFLCPFCSSTSLVINSGRELNIVEIEVI